MFIGTGRDKSYSWRQEFDEASANFLRKTRIGGNGAPSFLACIRTFFMLRLSAAAARMIDASCATNSLRRALSSSVQGLLAKPTMFSVSLRRLKPACRPARVR